MESLVDLHLHRGGRGPDGDRISVTSSSDTQRGHSASMDQISLSKLLSARGPI